MPVQFESLRDQLLRGGVAARHVTRYLTELTEHLDDLIAEAEREGLDREAAEGSALSRLGDTDNLANTMIARKEFRSWSHRAPWAVFFLAPLASLVAINLASLVLFVVIVEFFGSASARVPIFVPSWFRGLYTAITEFDLFLLPLMVGWAISCIAVRQRMKPLWPVVGLVVIAVFCGLQTYDIQWSPAPNGLNGFGVGWPFVPHGSRITVGTSFRVLLNLGLTVTLYSLWRLRRLHRATDFRQLV
jgi:hypothetical protein